MVTLFSCMNGDAVHEVFDLLFGYSPFLGWTGRIFLSVYILIFVCTVLNIFTLIMEDAYFSLKRENEQKLDVTNVEKMNDDEVEDVIQHQTTGNLEEIDARRTVIETESIEENFLRLTNVIKEQQEQQEQQKSKLSESQVYGRSLDEFKLQTKVEEYMKTLTTGTHVNFIDLLSSRSMVSERIFSRK